MKSVIATVITAFAVTSAFAADAKKEEPKRCTQGRGQERRKESRSKEVILARRGYLQFLQLQGRVDDTEIVVFDDAIARNLNRLRVKDLEDDDQELSESVQWRLFLARQLAVLSA